MADQTIEITFDTQHSFRFWEGETQLPNGDVTVETRGTNCITFARRSGQTWQFDQFSMSLGVQSDAGQEDVVTVGPAYGDSFSWTVADDQVVVTDEDEVPAGSTHTYKYSFRIWTGETFVNCDPKIYNRIQ